MKQRHAPSKPAKRSGGSAPNFKKSRAHDAKPRRPGAQPMRFRPKVSSPRSRPATPTAPKIHPCPECGKRFPTEAGMQTHQYNVHGSAPMTVGVLTRCTECGVLVRPKRLSEHRERMHGLR